MKNSNFVLAAIVATSLVSFTATAEPAAGEAGQPGEHRHHFMGPAGNGEMLNSSKALKIAFLWKQG